MIGVCAAAMCAPADSLGGGPGRNCDTNDNGGLCRGDHISAGCCRRTRRNMAVGFVSCGYRCGGPQLWACWHRWASDYCCGGRAWPCGICCGCGRGICCGCRRGISCGCTRGPCFGCGVCHYCGCGRDPAVATLAPAAVVTFAAAAAWYLSLMRLLRLRAQWLGLRRCRHTLWARRRVLWPALGLR